MKQTTVLYVVVKQTTVLYEKWRARPAACCANNGTLRPPFFMSLHLLILHRRELTFSYEICLPASGNDQNRVP